MKKYIFTLIIFVFCINLTFSQTKYLEIFAGTNYGHLKEQRLPRSVRILNYFTPSFGIQAGFMYGKQIATSSHTYISVSPSIAYYPQKERLPEYNNELVWDRHIATLNCPVMLNFKTGNILTFAGGLNNRIFLWADKNTASFTNDEVYKYTLGFAIALKIKIAQKLSFNTYFMQDLNPFIKCVNDFVFFRMQNFDFSINYSL